MVLQDRLAPRVEAWRPGAEIVEVTPLSGGSSSLTYLVGLKGAGESTVVLKLAPPGLAPVRNRDVLRQSRLLRALEGTPVLAPRSLFDDPGVPPEVPPYFAMDLVPGECVEPVLQPIEDRPDPGEVLARTLDAARALAVLHTVVPDDIGLGEEPVTTVEDEIDRWSKAFETVPPDLRGNFRRAAAALHASVPPALRPVVNHGDYRLGNTLCRDARVEAIIDWEIWSLGDPRVDVTWLTFFTDEAEHPAAEPGTPAGTPSKREVVAAYESAAGTMLPDMGWFDALTKYKEAAATALLLKRGRGGGSMPPPMLRMEAGVPRLIQECITALN